MSRFSILASRRRQLLGSIALTLLVSSPVVAQVDIEALRTDEPPLGLSGSLGGDLTIRTGNVDFIEVGLSARLQRVREGATTLVIGNGGIGLLGRERFSSSGLLHFRETYRTGSRLSPEWFGQINYDRARLLGFRALAGAGMRLALASGESGEVGAGAALMLEHERLILPDTAAHPGRTTVLRSSTFITLRVVPNDDVVVTSTTYLQPALEDLGDSRVLESLRLAASVSDRLALTVSFDLRYDSRPPDGIAALDTTLRTGVTYTY